MKVKIFYGTSNSLEKQINDFLEKENVRINKIEYTSFKTERNGMMFSALMVYYEQPEVYHVSAVDGLEPKK